jgi:hypothetical protein
VAGLEWPSRRSSKCRASGCRGCCYSFLCGFKGAPPARQRRAGGPDASRRREVIEPGCVIESGTTTRTTAGSGGPACRLRGGGHVALLRAEALRARRRQVSRPAPAGRRYPPSQCADGRACNDRAWPSSVPGILSPRKLTVKGAPTARR